MATVLVVGGRGFLGGFIVAALRRQGWRVRTLARPQGRTLGDDEVAGDLTRMLSEADWVQALDGVTAVVNAAGILREEGRQTFEDVHYRAPLALANGCAKRGIRFVQVSALGHPDDGGFIASKHRFDAALLALPLVAVVLRPSVVYSHRGSYGGTSLLRALAAFPGRSLLPGDGRWKFQPLSTEDLAEVVAAACTRGAPGVHDLGCEHPIALHHYQALWRQWLQIAGRGAWQVPLPLVKCQVWLGQALGRGPVNRAIWNMLLRGNLAAPGSHQRVMEAFGVRVRALDEVLSAEPSQMQDRWAAQLYFLAPWLKWSVIALWLWSGVVGLLTPASRIETLTHGSVLAEMAPVMLARAAALLDLALGLALALVVRPRPVVLAMLASVAAYLFAFGVGLPALFMDSLGGLVKNVALLPALAVLWVLVDRR
ncbi:DoxX-like family protein [Thermomonas fusca]|uniref:DoxX-like family protein n=1 Tax=Thermomonas fusca TaxID=215690 RepID=UPI001486C992|nr:DoxX-like family protein [Thermomonas fusca]